MEKRSTGEQSRRSRAADDVCSGRCPIQPRPGLDAVFVALFTGLRVGGVGAEIAGLGLLRYARQDAQSSAPDISEVDSSA